MKTIKTLINPPTKNNTKIRSQLKLKPQQKLWYRRDEEINKEPNAWVPSKFRHSLIFEHQEIWVISKRTNFWQMCTDIFTKIQMFLVNRESLIYANWTKPYVVPITIPIKRTIFWLSRFYSFTYSHIRHLAEAAHTVQDIKNTDQKNTAKQRFLKADEPNRKPKSTWRKQKKKSHLTWFANFRNGISS